MIVFVAESGVKNCKYVRKENEVCESKGGCGEKERPLCCYALSASATGVKFSWVPPHFQHTIFAKRKNLKLIHEPEIDDLLANDQFRSQTDRKKKFDQVVVWLGNQQQLCHHAVRYRIVGSSHDTGPNCGYSVFILSRSRVVNGHARWYVATSRLSHAPHTSHTTLFSIHAAPYAPRLALFHIFDWHQVSLHSFQGWMIFIAFFLNAFAVAAAIRVVIRRAKKCLDFSATVYFLHLLAVSMFSGGFPHSLVWWLCGAVNLAVTAVFSEWLCLQHEMKEIPLASIPRQRNRGAQSASTTELTNIVTSSS